MIKLTSQAMTNAIQSARNAKLHARKIGDRIYSVHSSSGNTYTVTFVVTGNLKLASCTCPSRHVCKHIAAAAALNIAIHSNYSRPSVKEKPAVRVPAPVVLVKREEGGAPIDNWWV
jgi:SWIM zinc finger